MILKLEINVTLNWIEEIHRISAGKLLKLSYFQYKQWFYRNIWSLHINKTDKTKNKKFWVSLPKFFFASKYEWLTKITVIDCQHQVSDSARAPSGTGGTDFGWKSIKISCATPTSWVCCRNVRNCAMFWWVK